MKRAIYILVPVLMLALAGCGDDEGGEAEQPVISDLSTLFQESDRQRLVGRQVRLNATASQVVGDYAFWVGSRGAEVPVFLEGEFRGTQPEGEVQVRGGSTYSITGTVRLVDNLASDSDIWKLVDEQERAAIQAAVIYLSADRVLPAGR